MNNKITKKIISFITIAVSLLLAFIPFGYKKAYGNSAQISWGGVTGGGLIVNDTDCPLEVEEENLVFNILEEPLNFYNTYEDFLQYNNNVSAEYTFYNPEDYDINATLVFPFGGYPDYAYFENDKDISDISKYSITVDDKEVNKTIRHTLSPYDYSDIYKIENDYITDSFYKKDTIVTVYCFDVSGIKSDYAEAIIELNFNKNETHLFFSKYNFYSGEKGIKIGVDVKNGDVIEVYAIGKPLEEYQIRDWKIYSSSNMKKIIDGFIEYNSSKTRTFSFIDFVKKYYKENSEVSEIDWYNAVVRNIIENRINGFFGGKYLLNIDSRLMRWYEYHIEVKAKSTIKNKVSAPIYPDINGNYSPSIYNYNYYLSPAKSWKSFSNLNITINTPYFLIDNKDKFVKKETGYFLSSDTLPNGELSFNLCSEIKPVYTNRFHDNGCLTVTLVLLLSVIVFYIAFFIMIIVLVIILAKRKHNKND